MNQMFSKYWCDALSISSLTRATAGRSSTFLVTKQTVRNALLSAIGSATYFTLRSGGKTIITFLFDSVFIWCVSVPIAFVLSRYTGIHVLVIYACVQLADLIKCVIGFVLVKKGVWLQNIVSS